MARGKGKPKKLPHPDGWANPAEHYIYGEESLTIPRLAGLWRGHRGCSERMLRDRCAKEKWVVRRERYQKELMERAQRKLVAERSDRKAEQIERTLEEHAKEAREARKAGRQFMNVAIGLSAKKARCEHCGELTSIPADDMKAEAAMRSGVTTWDKGVNVERKAMGVFDRIVIYERTAEIAVMVMDIVGRYIDSPEVMQNIIRDLESMKSDLPETKEIEGFYKDNL